MGRKTTLWIFHMTKWQYGTREDIDKATKRKSYERNKISSYTSTKKHYKNKNIYYFIVKIHKTQQIRKCTLCRERDETIRKWMQMTSTEGIQKCTRLVGIVNPLGIVQKVHFTIIPHCICTNQNPFLRMRHIKYPRIFRYTWISLSRPEDQI